MNEMVNSRKKNRQEARYCALIEDCRNLLLRVLRLEQSILIVRQIDRDLKSGSLISPKAFVQALRSDIMKSVCIQLRTLIDDSPDVIGIGGLLCRMQGEVGLLTKQRWSAARKIWGNEYDRAGQTFAEIWNDAASIPEKNAALTELSGKIEGISNSLRSWISQSVAHEVRGHKRKAYLLMEGNVFNGARLCAKIVRNIMQMLADVDPMNAELPVDWRFSY